MKNQNFYFLGIVLFGSIFVGSVDAADETDVTRLRQNILRNYDPHTRPVQNHKNATTVDVSFLYKTMELDEKRMLLTLHVTSYFIWEDQHIKWDPKDYNNLTYIIFAAHELWKPDLAVYNNVDASEIDHYGNTRIYATHDSFIAWFPNAKFQVGCELDLSYWPYDTHWCYVQIGSWAHDADQISLTIDRYSHYYYDEILNREWKIVGHYIDLRTYNFSCCPEPYQDVVISLDLQRKGSTHTAVVLIVAYGIACTILLSFWLSPHANERVPVVLTVLIINALFLSYVYKIISSNGRNVPLVVAYYRDSLILVTFNLIWTILLRYIAVSRRSSPVPLPGIVSTFLDSWPAKILCLNPRPEGRSTSSVSSTATDEDEKDLVNVINLYQEDWTWLAYLLDRVMFVIYLIIYICFFVAFFY